ncbi:hypothetical protein SAMN05421847_0292 [Halpernia humi]|uniref:DUF2202 domain-containing protein n=2 Tax=Halpernia humi TaxID=493375 RepID=A0A1H5SX22_9FLAO|nr:hypothetical protein SAMN05421847_0292 [Halpernia humi]
MIVGVSFLTSCKTDDEVVLLSDQEKSDLLFLREEEKLARDVYIFSYNKYNQSIFSNIADSEQSHTNSVLNLINKYNLSDPVADNAIGVFSNSELQTLYNQLIAISDSSLNKALEVGANIEDLDINDINRLISHTSNSDLQSVYSNLTCGSKNHMRSFVGQLGLYTPIYISQSEYDSIINSPNEQCGK